MGRGCAVRPGVWLAVLVGALVQGCSAPDGSLGQRIFRDGEGDSGRLAYQQGPGWLARGRFGCVVCHGEDGAGRFVQAGQVAGAAPPITAEALAARGYDRAALRRAIADGVAPDGRLFSYYMPRWQMREPEMQALLDFLARL